MDPEPTPARVRRSRRRRRQTLVALVAVIGATVLVSAIWIAQAGSRAWRLSVTVKPETGIVLPIAGYSYVTVPPNALAHPATVAIERVDAGGFPAVAGKTVQAVGDPFATTVDGRLLGLVTVGARFDRTRVLRADPQASVLLAAFDRHDRSWIAAPSTVATDTRQVLTRTTVRQAVWRPFSLDTAAIARRIGTSWMKLYARQPVAVARPRCTTGQPARITPSSFAVFPVCAVRSSGRMHLRLVNDRGYGVVVIPPFGATIVRDAGRTSQDRMLLDLGDLITHGDGTYLPSGMAATVTVSGSAVAAVRVGPSASSLAADFDTAAVGPFSSSRLVVFAPGTTQAQLLAACSKSVSKSVSNAAGPGGTPPPADFFLLEWSCLVRASEGISPGVDTFARTPVPNVSNTSRFFPDWRFSSPSGTGPFTLSSLTTTLTLSPQ